MKKKIANGFVCLYLLFLSLLLVEIFLDKIQQKTNGEDKMIICLNEDVSDEVEKQNMVVLPCISDQRKINKEVIVNEMKYNLSLSDYTVLLKIVESEAGCEDYDGKALVANVIMNRVNSAKFPNSVSEVVYQNTDGKIQFAPAYNGRINTVSVSEETKKAVDDVLRGYDPSQGAMYFASMNVVSSEKSNWFYNHLTCLFVHGRHTFFK